MAAAEAAVGGVRGRRKGLFHSAPSVPLSSWASGCSRESQECPPAMQALQLARHGAGGADTGAELQEPGSTWGELQPSSETDHGVAQVSYKTWDSRPLQAQLACPQPLHEGSGCSGPCPGLGVQWEAPTFSHRLLKLRLRGKGRAGQAGAEEGGCLQRTAGPLALHALLEPSAPGTAVLEVALQDGSAREPEEPAGTRRPSATWGSSGRRGGRPAARVTAGLGRGAAVTFRGAGAAGG